MTTKFTWCDYAKVKEAHAALYEIAEELKCLFKLEETETKTQKSYIKKLWVLAQRYRILDKGAPGVSLYPDVAVERILCEMMDDMNRLVKSIHQSNKTIQEYIESLQPFYRKLDKIVKEIDWRAGDGLIQGNDIFKPLFHYVETVADLRRNFKKNAVERKVLEDMLDIHHCVTIEAYEALLMRSATCRDDFAHEICFSELFKPKS